MPCAHARLGRPEGACHSRTSRQGWGCAAHRRDAAAWTGLERKMPGRQMDRHVALRPAYSSALWAPSHQCFTSGAAFSTIHKGNAAHRRAPAAWPGFEKTTRGCHMDCHVALRPAYSPASWANHLRLCTSCPEAQSFEEHCTSEAPTPELQVSNTTLLLAARKVRGEQTADWPAQCVCMGCASISQKGQGGCGSCRRT